MSKYIENDLPKAAHFQYLENYIKNLEFSLTLKILNFVQVFIHVCISVKNIKHLFKVSRVYLSLTALRSQIIQFILKTLRHSIVMLLRYHFWSAEYTQLLANRL